MREWKGTAEPASRPGKAPAAAIFPLRSAGNNARSGTRTRPVGMKPDGRTSMPSHRCCGADRSPVRFRERLRLECPSRTFGRPASGSAPDEPAAAISEPLALRTSGSYLTVSRRPGHRKDPCRTEKHPRGIGSCACSDLQPPAPFTLLLCSRRFNLAAVQEQRSPTTFPARSGSRPTPLLQAGRSTS